MPDPFLERVLEIQTLRRVNSLLDWDLGTNMPKKGADQRAKASSLLAILAHQKLIDPRFGDLAREASESEDGVRKDAGEAWLQEYEDALCVPEALVSAMAAAESEGYALWQEGADQTRSLQSLAEIVRLKRAYADCFPQYKTYDLILQDFEPDVSESQIFGVFASLKPLLVSLHQQTKPSKVGPEIPVLDHRRLFPLCRSITSELGFDYSRGHLGVTLHPFMNSLGKDDVRISVTDCPDRPLYTIGAAIHEAGHGIYEQNVGYTELGLDDLSSSALHESQSLFYERMLGTSEGFWGKWLFDLNAILSHPYDSPAQVVGQLQKFDPRNLIRLQSSDIDYGLHIILRFEIERELFSGVLEVVDLPERFASGCEEMFGRRPSSQKENFWQDCHWLCGLFGYFPSYLLGKIFAAQLWSSVQAQGLLSRHTAEEYREVRSYLTKTVHLHGGRYSFFELVQREFGELSTSPYLQHLEQIKSFLE